MTRLRKIATNWYTYILLVPLTVFCSLMAIGIAPDQISLPGRIGVFFVLAYVTARYAGRAPMLVWENNVTPEGRNIAGWSLFLASQMLVQIYAILTISLSEDGIRPAWLSSYYYSPAFVSLGLVGLILVASSIPKFPMPPFFGPGKGMSTTASLIVAIMSAGALWIASHMPMVVKAIVSMFGVLVHAG